MFTLRLTQFSEGDDKYRVSVEFEGDSHPRQSTTVQFKFKLSSQLQEDLRWYLEDYLQYPLDPAPKIAIRIEHSMDDLGAQIFRSIFHSADDARDLWATVRPLLNDTRVEVITDAAQAAAIPWELIRDPKTNTPLTLRARSFVCSVS